MRAEIITSLAGLAVDMEVLDEPSTGSSHDIRSATSDVIAMADAGMLENAPFISPSAFGVSSIGSLELPRYLNDKFGRAVEKEMAQAKAQALELAAKHRENVLALARIVVVRRRLSDNDLLEALRSAGVEESISRWRTPDERPGDPSSPTSER